MSERTPAIKNITVLSSGSGSDVILVEYDAPEAVFPYNGNLHMRFNAAKGTGVDYVRAHFDIEPTIKHI